MRPTALLLLALTLLTGCPDPASSAKTAASPTPTAASTPAPTPTPTPTPKAAPALWRPSLAGVEILPDHPLQGSIAGQPFKPDQAVIEEGILKLREGKGFLGDRTLTVFLFQLPSGAIPAGRSYSAEPGKRALGAPHVHVGWKDGKAKHRTAAFAQKQSLRLVFGDEAEGHLPFKIWTCLPDEAQSYLVGAGRARIEGFRLVDGKVDARADSFKVLKWLARDYLERRSKRPIEIAQQFKAVMNSGNPTRPYKTGLLELRYRAGPKGADRAEWLKTPAKERGKTRGLKVVFSKEGGAWKATRVLRLDQLVDAHPATPPLPPGKELKGRAASQVRAAYLRYVVALWLERKLQAAHAQTGIVHVWLSPSASGKGIGTCRVQYQLEGTKDRVRLQVLVRQNPDQTWKVERELKPKERLDWTTGKVVGG